MATASPQPDPDPPSETLRRLEARLRSASDAAERLFGEAAASALGASAAGEAVPPRGWQVRGDGEPAGPGEVEQLLALLEPLRQMVPPELRQRLQQALRELLLALRALIDWYLERAVEPEAQAPRVQDIPIL